MLINPENETVKQEVLDYFNLNYHSNMLCEIKYEDFLNTKYKRVQKSQCCITPLSLLIYCIFIAIFTFAGIYFCISKNEGYISFKALLERNMSLFNNDFPNDYETAEILAYLNRPEGEDIDCDFILYSLGKCDYGNYSNFCTDELYSDEKCNYMDRQIYLGYYFTCNLDNYQNGMCNQVQYIHYAKSTGEISYESKIYNITDDHIQIDLRGLSFENLWRNIGDYDRRIYLSFIISWEYLSSFLFSF